jgi:cytochrome b561
MKLRNSDSQFGVVAIVLHWIAALAVIGLFASGIYMRSLTYYDSLYQVLPFYHKSFGVVLMLVILFRLVWRFANPQPKPLSNHSAIEKKGAKVAHFALYLLMLAVMVAGYLISTAKGKPVDVFGLFELPATLYGLSGQGDIAGMVHEYLAYGLIGIAVLHALGALKHHFIDKDRTLMRMIKGA